MTCHAVAQGTLNFRTPAVQAVILVWDKIIYDLPGIQVPDCLTEMCHPSANVYNDHIEGSYRPSGMTGTAYGVISVRYFRVFLFHSPWQN